ncbi:MAG: glycosyltransferase family 4 protein [Bacteroidetes bacterium]|nr:glycosyltransferase family 4 protein [Bacteroidota bacterium]
MSRIQRIALLTDGVFPMVVGGMQKHSLFLLVYLLKNRVEVLLYHPGGKGRLSDHIAAELLDGIVEKIIPFPSSGLSPGSYLRRSFRYSLSILEDLKKQQNIHFIYAQGFTGWALVSAKQRGESLPLVGVNLHGLEMFQQAYGFKQQVIQYYFKGPVKYLCRHADVVYSLGGRLTELIKKNVPSAEISQIPIGLSKDWILSQGAKSIKATSKRIVLFIGRQEHRKGLHLLSKVLKEVRYPDLEFQFVGPLNIRDMGSKNGVLLHGEIRDEQRLKEILDAADVLILPSLAEGMPTVILEAMARGLAILASDVGAVNELVDGANGVLMASNDTKAIEQALMQAQAWSAEELQSKSKASALRFIDNFTWEAVIERTLQDMENRLTER